LIATGAASEALVRLEHIRTQWPETVWAGRAAFWRAKLEVGRDEAAAIEWGLQASTELPVVGDYALFMAGEAARGAGEPERAARIFDTLVRLYAESPLVPDALTTSAESWLQIPEQRDEGIARLRTLINRHSQDSRVPGALAKLGEALAATGRRSDAGLAYRRLWIDFPASPEAGIVADRLQELVKQGATPAVTFAERRRRAEALGRVGRHADALSAWQALGRSAPSRTVGQDVALQRGITLYRLRRWDEAGVVFRRLGSSGVGELREEALLWEGRAALRRDDGVALRRADMALTKAFPESPGRLEVLSLRGAWHRGRGETRAAMEAYRALGVLAAALGRSDKVVEAQWYLGWLEYRRGALEPARAAFEHALTAAPATDPQIPQLLYWIGRIETLRGAADAARELETDLATRYPYTYYGYLARRALHAGAELPLPDPRWSSAHAVSEVQPDAADLGPAGQAFSRRAAELWTLGLRTEAREELLVAVRRTPPPSERVPELADALAQVGADDEALRMLRRQFAPALERGDPALSWGVWRRAYPGHLLDAIRQRGGERVDPFLVAGLIREESVYDPKAVSPVGAIGLMQIMPETGRRVARAVGLPSFTVDQLYTPDVNLTLGVTYLADLLERFAGNEAYAVAAYNAGPEAVVRWIENAPPRPIEEFIEEIPYAETRFYVKRVLRSAWEYRALYDAPSPARVVWAD
jgi:soluble lytic murein transglycosylase